MRSHVKPAIGKTRLRALTSTQIDRLYAGLAGKMSETTRRHVHVALGSCLGTAVRKKLLARSPVEDVEKVPTAGKFEHDGLDDTEIARLVAGFWDSPIYPMVAVAAFTSARLREILALPVEDVYIENRIVAITRAVEEVRGAAGSRSRRRSAGSGHSRSTRRSPACLPNIARTCRALSLASRRAPMPTCH
jgi:hypothetical protein